ncbi:MAG: two-component system, cell cycle sensor histidine kinase and response regulator CckA, partial [Acidobacteriota bacterium]|nr:two-component system, cell cycle sensor histidine kinase and response regulator CckA [Acidobacteriota bacterium]
MSHTATETKLGTPAEWRAKDLFNEQRQTIYRRTDRLFMIVMGLQWLAGIGFALWISPRAWAGMSSHVHPHVWAAVLLGGAISFFPMMLALVRPGQPSTRYTIAVAQMLMGALLIHLTGGRIETHFHVFGSLAFLAFYRDWRVLVPATIVVAADHLLRGMLWPESVYGVLTVSNWRWLEHASWVVFEDIFLIVSLLWSRKEMFSVAERTAELEESEARYRELFENASDIVYTQDLSGNFTSLNKTGERLTGYTREEATKMNVTNLVPPEQVERARQMTRHKLSGGASPVYEMDVLRKDGQLITLEMSTRLNYKNGAPVEVQGIARDVTGRKEAEAARRESEARYRIVAETATDAIVTIDEASIIQFANQAAERIFGYTQQELLGAPLTILMPEALRHAHAHGLKRYAATGERKMNWQAVEVRGLRKDGREIPLELSFGEYAEGGKRIFTGIIRDISERKRLETEREVLFEIMQGVNDTPSLEELLRLIHRAIGRIIYAENYYVALVDRETGLLSLPFLLDEHDTEAAPPQKIGRGCTGYVFRTGCPILMTRDIFDDLVARGEVEVVGTAPATWLGVPLKTQSETIGVLVVQHYTDPLAYSERDVKFLSSVGSQIAMAIERKRNEDALRASEEQYRTIFSDDLTGIIISTPDGRALSVNPAFARIFGFGSVEEAMSHNTVSIYPSPEARAQMLERLRRERRLDNYEIEMRRIDGTIIHTVENISGVFDAAGELVEIHGYVFDDTRRKELEAQLQQSQKMEAVGKLAGGIAHDFNNLLTAINGYSDLMLRRIKEGDPVRRHAEEIKKAGMRAADLTRQLLAFSRKQVLQPIVLDPNEIVADMNDMLQRLIGEDVQLLTCLRPEIGRVKADPHQLSQVIMNLSVNARDAMPRGGKLTIETANVYLDEEYARRHLSTRAGHYVMLAVSDTGTGMDAQTQARIFEPFFTTKEVGKGTGLGLSTVYGIVKQSGGNVWVYSEPGHGTTFKIYLPRVGEEARHYDAGDTDCETTMPTGTETILLVEDETMVRNMTHEILRMCGYRVIEASLCSEALRLCE